MGTIEEVLIIILIVIQHPAFAQQYITVVHKSTIKTDKRHNVLHFLSYLQRILKSMKKA